VAEAGTSKSGGGPGLHNKPLGCGASEVYALGPACKEEEEGDSQAAAVHPSYLASQHPMVITTFLSLWRFSTILGHVTFLTTLKTVNLAYVSRSTSHNRVYWSFPFALQVTLVT